VAGASWYEDDDTAPDMYIFYHLASEDPPKTDDDDRVIDINSDRMEHSSVMEVEADARAANPWRR
jgi:hypothetical protein